jgi:hypothetical protein
MEARIQQTIPTERKSRACEVARPSPAKGPIGLIPPGKMSGPGWKLFKKQGRQRSIDANGLASPGLKLAYAIRCTLPSPVRLPADVIQFTKLEKIGPAHSSWPARGLRFPILIMGCVGAGGAGRRGKYETTALLPHWL